MQIHLSRPGGQKEGPYSLEQINRDLAANKYRDTDYWAWHEGLTEWVPLYALPGVRPGGGSAPAGAAGPQPEEAAAANQPEPAAPADSVNTAPARPAPDKPQPATQQAPATAASAPSATATPEPKPAAAAVKPQIPPPSPSKPAVSSAPAPPAAKPSEELAGVRQRLPSGLPSAALEEVFLFTTGDGPSAWQSPTLVRMLKEIIGEDLSTLREAVSRDVVARCAVSELLKPDGSISEAVWHAMAAHRPALVQQARERLYHICVRTFRIEADTIVALVLFYDKAKLGPDSAAPAPR